VDTVIGDGGTEFDLHELGRRILVFKRGLTDAVAAAALAEIGFRIRLELLVALVSDRRADGEAEYVFCLEFVESAIVLCARYDRDLKAVSLRLQPKCGRPAIPHARGSTLFVCLKTSHRPPARLDAAA
jgi:hypothetical protein